jgi:(p)ppGpp synthase/HD superfamily hydrolase
MRNEETRWLGNMTLAPYIQKATALVGHRRRVGGNQFRHAMATMAILIDYHQIDPVLLKASLIHDLIEDVPETDQRALRHIDEDGNDVVDLVLEVTDTFPTKRDYLRHILEHGSRRAKLLKVADRISNITDLNHDVFSSDYIARMLDESLEFVYPIALQVNGDMAVEIKDLIEKRRALLD